MRGGASLDGERDRFALGRNHAGFVVVGVDDHETGLPDARQCSPGTESGQPEWRAQAEFDRVDRSCLGGGVVEYEGTRTSFGHRQLLVLGARIEAGQRPTAVAVDEDHTTGRLVDEPCGCPSRGDIDCRKPIGAHDDDHGEQRQQRRCGSSDGFAPGHGRKCHDVLNSTASGRTSPLVIGTACRELKKSFRFPVARDVTML